ncbi:alpha/beta hydrolase [Octadecabacter sp. 1_MG-2023]|uniref:alpha/beta fold hydrolase n=1 Tax=unclassified Octadecabacter TaxID=196158 RepID=UPI001C0957D0|nr:MULTISPECIES: alpha/beta hydrolase [unclassified Octadecabacter]MBU2992830.1 alpha/beta hydrolase [Octadecabacter sp. B2R22]MDO6733719.1 alpha/beta hydrolase [Octadecabacter sp. 1_MG-2023]
MAEPLILLPGMMSDARVWATQLTVMSYERPVTIAPVCVGDRIEEIASGLLSSLPSKFALCGHGLGGAIALELVRRAPERVIRLALIGTNPLSDTPQEAADREPRMIGAKSGRFETLLETDILPRHVGQGPLRAHAMAELQEMALSLGPDVYARQERAMQRRRDQQSTLRRITQPTLVLAGGDDKIVPLKRQEFLAELIPYAKLAVLDGVGHMTMLEDPEGTAEALFAWMQQPLVLR